MRTCVKTMTILCALFALACTEDPEDDGPEGAGGSVVIDTDGTVDEDGGTQIVGGFDAGEGAPQPWCTPDEFEAEAQAYCEAQFAPGRVGAECNANDQCDTNYCYAGGICVPECGDGLAACAPGTRCTPAFDGTDTSGCVANNGIECEHYSGSLTECLRNVNDKLEGVCSPRSDEDCAEPARAYLTCLGGLGQVCPESRFDDCAVELVRVESCCDNNCRGPW